MPEGLTARARSPERIALCGVGTTRAANQSKNSFAARIGAPRVRIPDLRREEFKEAIGGALAVGGDKGGGMRGGEGGKLVHAGMALLVLRIVRL